MRKPRILYAVVVAVILFFTWLYKEPDITFTALYAVLLLLLVSLGAAISAPRFLTLRQKAPVLSVFKNEPLSLETEINNRSILFYPNVTLLFHSPELIDYGENAARCAIPPRESFRQERLVRFPYRGVYEVGVEGAVISDPLGLFRFDLHWKETLSVTVLPQSDDRFTLPQVVETRSSVYSHTPFDEDYTAMADVRKYQSSDSLRKVHWPLSAKRGELISKSYQAFTPNTTCLILDLTPIPLEKAAQRAAFEDCMVSYVASAASYCSRSRLPARLVCEGADLELDPAGDPRELYSLLARLDFDSQEKRLQPALALPPATNLALFLSGLDDSGWAALAGLASYDRVVILYYFHCPALPLSPDRQESLTLLERHGVIVNKVEIPWKAHELPDNQANQDIWNEAAESPTSSST